MLGAALLGVALLGRPAAAVTIPAPESESESEISGAKRGVEGSSIIEVRAQRGVRGLIAEGGADIVDLTLRNRGGEPQQGTVRIGDGAPAAFRLPAGGSVRLVLVRELPRRVRLLAPVDALLTVAGRPQTRHRVPGAEVVPELSLIIDSDATLLAEAARTVGHLRGRAVLASVAELPPTWLVLRGATSLFLRDGASPRLAARATALGLKVCRLEEASFTCVDPMSPRSLRRYPPPPTVRPGMKRLGRLSLAIGMWLVILLAVWRYAARRRWPIVMALLPLVVAAALPARWIHGATVDGAGYRATAGTETYVVARVRARAGLERRLPVVGSGELWLRPDASDALRGELREFRPPAPVRFVDERTWRIEGFIASADVRGWAAQLEPLGEHP